MTKDERTYKLGQVFTPSAPVARRDLFAGRVDQILAITTAIRQPGKHVVLFGARGVGKTSLANQLTDLLTPILGASAKVIRINCNTRDIFSSIWSKVLDEFGIEKPDNWRYETPDPDEIRRILDALAVPTVIVLDEFERMEDDESLSLMADTIKALSDRRIAAKLVIVGVADSIVDLIGEHESIQRVIEQ